MTNTFYIHMWLEMKDCFVRGAIKKLCDDCLAGLNVMNAIDRAHGMSLRSSAEFGLPTLGYDRDASRDQRKDDAGVFKAMWEEFKVATVGNKCCESEVKFHESDDESW